MKTVSVTFVFVSNTINAFGRDLTENVHPYLHILMIASLPPLYDSQLFTHLSLSPYKTSINIFAFRHVLRVRFFTHDDWHKSFASAELLLCNGGRHSLEPQCSSSLIATTGTSVFFELAKRILGYASVSL